MRLPRRAFLAAWFTLFLATPAIAVKIPAEVNKTVTFLFLKTGANEFRPIGTGFFGSPVFLYPEVDHESGSLNLGPPDIKLAGVMHGHFYERRKLELAKQGDQAVVPVSTANVGVAAVVPAHLLHEILFSEGLKKMREPGSASRANEKE